MEIIVGTYEEVLLGYRLINVEKKWQFEQSFTDNSHTGCVKTVTVSNKGILASGGTDETIRLFNLKKRLELGSLVHHSGTICGLEFYKGNHLFSVSEDGSAGIWKYFTWECLKTLRGHKSGINNISVHPSGKLALTVSRDKSLKTWNLISGKCAYTTNLKSVADIVLWSPEGTYYAVVFQTKIDIYKVETSVVHCTINVVRRPNDAAFLSETVLAYGCEGGTVHFHDLNYNKEIHLLETDTNRIRGISFAQDDELQQCLVTASSDGYIKLYQIKHTQENIETTLLAEHDSKFRLTCIAVYTPKISSEKIKTVEKASEDSVETEHEVAKGHNSSFTIEKEKPSKKQKKKEDLSKTVSVTFEQDTEVKQSSKKRKKKMQKQNAKKLKS